MDKPSLTAIPAHPIHAALEKLHLLVRDLLAGVESPEATRMRRATARALVTVEVAAAGLRRDHHLKVAMEALVSTRAGFRLLFLEGKVAAETVDEARRRINRILTALDGLNAAEGDWSKVELPALEDAPKDLAQDPTIKGLRRVVARAAAVARAVRERERRSSAGSQKES
jgi:hypothetical protein